MYNVIAVPETFLGVVGDRILNTTNGDVYEKIASTIWTKRGNFKGAQGTKGAADAKGDKSDPGDAIKVGTSTTNAVSRKLSFKVIG